MTKGKQIGVVALGLVAVAVIVALAWPRDKRPEFDTATVTRGDVVQAVEATGVLTYPATRRAAFLQGGRLAFVAPVGTEVAKGQVLATLENPTPEVQNDMLVVTAPIDGIVTAAYAGAGEVVQAGTPVVLVQGPARTFQ